MNKKFLEYSTNNIDLLRLNMSHISLNSLEKNIKFIKKYTNTQICIDTEGAQIRSKIKKKKFFKRKTNLKITKNNSGDLCLYPQNVFEKIKINDVLNIGFDNLKVKIKKIDSYKLDAIVIREGLLENNKGIHVENRKVNLNFVTNKDLKAIKIASALKIKNFALSFTNSSADVVSFGKLLPNKSSKIYKIETKLAVKNFIKITKVGSNFLIDRGDLSKDIDIINIPVVQRNIIKIKNNLKNKHVYIATNLLESMVKNNYPTRGEVNDIYSSLEMGSDGLVLAAETAIGKHPIECVKLIKQIINKFNKTF